jgi:hypothetical protein
MHASGKKENDIESSKQSSSLQLVLDLLNKFKVFREVQMPCDFILSQLNKIKSGDLSETQLADLAEKITKWSKDEKVSNPTLSNNSFKDVLQKTLGILPRNVEDFSTLENIKPDFRLMTSDRYQFDIRSLVRWINQKKKYINPYNQSVFTPADQKAIQEFAGSKGLAIDIIGSGYSQPQAEDPDLLRNAIAQVLGPGQHIPEVPNNPPQHFGFFQAPEPPDPNMNPIPIADIERYSPSVFLPNGDVVLSRRVSDSFIMSSRFYVYRRNTGEFIRRFSQDNQYVSGMAPLPNGNIVAGSSEASQQLRIYNPNNGMLVRSFSQQGDESSAIVTLQDGNFAALGHSLLRIFNPNDGTLLRSFPQPASVSYGGDAAILLRNGNIAYVCQNFNDSIHIINPNNGEYAKIGIGNVVLITELPTGELGVMTGRGSHAATIQIYNQENGELLREFYHQNEGIYNTRQLREKCNQLLVSSPERDEVRGLSLDFSENIRKAIAVLKERDIYNPSNEAVLRYFPRFAEQLAKGMITLHEANILNSDNCNTMKHYSSTAFADHIAKGLVILHEAGILDHDKQLLLKKDGNAEFADGIAEGLVILNQSNILNSENITRLTKFAGERRVALTVAKALAILSQANILTPDNREAAIPFIHQKFSINVAKGFCILHQANILNSDTRKLLTDNAEFSENVANGLVILHKENILDTSNSKCLTNDWYTKGRYAVEIAEGLVTLNKANLLNDGNRRELTSHVYSIKETVSRILTVNPSSNTPSSSK